VTGYDTIIPLSRLEYEYIPALPELPTPLALRSPGRPFARSCMKIFNLPDLGEGLAEAEIVRWHVNTGDYIKADDPMLAVETAKAIVEVPAPFSGVIKATHGKPGDTVATGALLVEFETDATGSDPVPARPTPAPWWAACPRATRIMSRPRSSTPVVSPKRMPPARPATPPRPTEYAQFQPHARWLSA